MTRYLLKRLMQTIIIVILVSLIAFFLVNLMPKNQVYALYGTDLTQEEYDNAYHALNLDKPILYRYFLWAKSFITGDFGTSYRYHRPVTEIIGQKIGITLYLSVISTLISFPIGILLGVLTAVNRGKWQDSLFTMLANLAGSIPGFVIGLILLYAFCIKFKLLPPPGTSFTFPWENPAKHLQQVIMPLVCLAIGGIAGVCRQTRSSMLEAIRQDYVRTARSKGLKENYIIKTHVLRNGLIPIITLIGGRLAHMIGGSVFVENVFSIPGMGTLMVQAVNDVDVPVMQTCVMLSALVISLAYLVTDFLYVVVDPRISLK